MKLNSWMREWFTHYVEPSAKEKTKFYYGTIIEKHLIPVLGDYDLEELTPYVIQQYVTQIMQVGNLTNGQGLSANTVNSIITVLQSALKQAYTLGNLEEYSANKVKRSKIKEKSVSFFRQKNRK